MFDSFKKKVLHHESVYDSGVQQDAFDPRITHHAGAAAVSCAAYDPVQRLLAVGSESGCVKVFGNANSELWLKGRTRSPIRFLHWAINEGMLVSISEDNTFQIFQMEARRAICNLQLTCDVSCTLMPMESRFLFVGTQQGDLVVVNVEQMRLSLYAVPAASALKGTKLATAAPELQALVALDLIPDNEGMLAMAYRGGVVVHWDLAKMKPERVFNIGEPITALAHRFDAKHFAVAHAQSGRISIWHTKDDDKPSVGFISTKATGMDVATLRWVENMLYIHVLDYALMRADEPMQLARDSQKSANKAQSPLDMLVMGDVASVAFVLPSPWPLEQDSASAVFAINRRGHIDTLDLSGPQTRYLQQNHSLLLDRTPELGADLGAEVLLARLVLHASEDLKADLEMAEISRGSDIADEGNAWPVVGGSWTGEREDFASTFRMLITAHSDDTVRFWDMSTAATRLIHVHACKRPENDLACISALHFCDTGRVLWVGWSDGMAALYRFTSMPFELVHTTVDRDGNIHTDNDAEPAHMNPGFEQILRVAAQGETCPVVDMHVLTKPKLAVLAWADGSLFILRYARQAAESSFVACVDVPALKELKKNRKAAVTDDRPRIAAMRCAYTHALAQDKDDDDTGSGSSAKYDRPCVLVADAWARVFQIDLSDGSCMAILDTDNGVDHVRSLLLVDGEGAPTSPWQLAKEWQEMDFGLDDDDNDDDTGDKTPAGDNDDSDGDDDAAASSYVVLVLRSRVDVISGKTGKRVASNDSVGTAVSADVVCSEGQNALVLMDESGSMAALSMLQLKNVFDFGIRALRLFMDPHARLLRQGPIVTRDGAMLLATAQGELSVVRLLLIDPEELTLHSSHYGGVASVDTLHETGLSLYKASIQHPKRPKGFFSSLFGSSSSVTSSTFHELFEGAEEPQDDAHGSSSSSSKSAISSASYEASETHQKALEAIQKLNERGQKISMIEQQTAEMEDEAREFAEAVDELVRQQQNKKWWEL